VARWNPTSPFVWRSSPIAAMPLIVFSDRIPISLDPHAFRIRPCRRYDHHPRRWRRSDRDSDGNLHLRVACPSDD
jgi:hypothetical protein